MRTVSSDTQKKLIFLPIINVLPFFIAIYNMIALNEGPRVLFKLYGYILIYSILPGIVGIILCQMLSQLLMPIYLCLLYVIPLLTSIGVIKFQEKHLYV